MKIDILNVDKLIDVNNLQEVKVARLFSTKMTYDPDGLLSTEIFGTSKGDRRTTFAYIDLKRPFIHPHIYHKVLKSIARNIVYVVSGQRRYSVQSGMMIEDDNGWTGIENLYKHWDEIEWYKSKSANKVNKELLCELKRDQIFLTKFPVCPPAYRDVMIAGTVDSSDHVNELNDLYVRLIRNVSLLSEGGIFARHQYAAQQKIQDTLVDIMIYFKNQISRKQGLIRKNLIGKSVDFGTRSVISAPTYNHERFEDNMIDIEHTALPIEQCCSNFYPFIEAWLKTFFNREVINDPNLIMFYDPEIKREVTAKIKDPQNQFSEKNIKRMINDYCLNPDNRFKPMEVDVIVPLAKGEKVVKASMILKGKVLFRNNTEEALNRPMTVTDILYLACVDVCEKRHVMVSRYPVGTDKGIYFNKIRVQSTVNHIEVLFNGKEYPFYPDIDMSLPHDKVGVQFIDTLVFSNAHLDGMGADYDGDQVSVRGIWSDEANLEAEEIMNRKMSALNITGTNSKKVAKEVFNSLYELTKNGPDPVTLDADDQKKYLALNVSDITRSYLADMFADMTNNTVKHNTDRRKPRHNTWDKMTIPAGYFYSTQPEIKTTVGRFIANKFMFEGSGIIPVLTYQNNVINKSVIEGIDDLIGIYLMEDKVTRKSFNTYIDRRDTLGYWLNGMLAHSISEKMLKPLPEIEKKKAELCKKYEKELAAGNIDVMTQISDELVKYAKELLKGDPGMDLFDSGDLDFGNNYKNNAIIKGAVINKITGEYDFISSSFMDGIDVKDIPAHANSILASQYPASIATADAGYLGKKLLALLQMIDIDEPGTDCGVKNLIPITIKKVNKNNLLYTYIDNGGGQLIKLTKDNIDSYVGKTVKMRSPMSCKHGKLCSRCASELFYLLGVEHAGLFGVQISHADLNLALKAKHNSLVNLYTLNPDDIIEDI